MKQIVVLAVLLAAASAGKFNSGLRARFTMNILQVGTAGFYDIPKTLSAAESDGWTETPRPENGSLSSLTMYCPVNRTLCALFDDLGYVSGLQVALDTSEFTGQPYDWGEQGFTYWTPSDDGKAYWTIQQYFIDADFLAMDSSERIELRTSSPVLPLPGIWLTGTNAEILKISNSSADIENSTFVKQSSVPFMGRHFYNNLSPTSPCDSSLYPWFLLTDAGQLVGTGFRTFGALPENPVKDWFERPSKLGVEIIVPDGPQCLYDAADSPGILLMHIYYVNEPWLILYSE